MISTDLYVAIILGLTLSLLFAEKFGINPGGLVVPGYLALTMKDPKSLIAIFLLSLLTYIIVEFGLNKFIILLVLFFLFARDEYNLWSIIVLLSKVAFLLIFRSWTFLPDLKYTITIILYIMTVMENIMRLKLRK